MRNLLVAGAVGIVAVPVAAQDHDAQLWLNGSASTALTEDVELGFETNQRFSDNDGGLYESEYILALTGELAGGIKLLGGVNRVVSYADGDVASTEWRPRQQISVPLGQVGPGAFKGRVRFEQRFRAGSDDVGLRLLPEIAYALPLSDTVELSVAHESYFTLNDTDYGQDAGHERMRNSATVAFEVSDMFGIEVGYMNQYRFNGADTDEMEHALTLAAAASF